MVLYTEAETAKILRVSERTLQRWREIGVGPAFTRLGRRIVYAENAIQDYVTRHTFSSISAADAADEITLNRAPAAVTASGRAKTFPRRRGRPRKDAKRSTPDDSTDSLTIRNVVARDHRVVRGQRWMHQTEECFGHIRKAA